MALFEPASQDPGFNLLYQQYLARQKNTEDLLQVVGDNSGLEGDFTTLEDVVEALVEQLPVVGDPVATTSGTSVSLITTIPSWARKITVIFNGVSLSGTDSFLVQMGPSGGLETSGYVSGSESPAGVSTSTAGFIVRDTIAAETIQGTYTFLLHESSTNTWVGSGDQYRAATRVHASAGTKAFAGAVTQISLVTTGVNTFDAGSASVRYEY